MCSRCCDNKCIGSLVDRKNVFLRLRRASFLPTCGPSFKNLVLCVNYAIAIIYRGVAKVISYFYTLFSTLLQHERFLLSLDALSRRLHLKLYFHGYF